MSIQEYLKQVMSGENLSYEEALAAGSQLMEKALNPIPVAGLLTALKTKGETYEEVAGFAMSLKKNAVSIKPKEYSKGDGFYDVVGTGGDGAHTFNISTTTAFVLAGAGIPVAKHGNRSISSKCGSADVLENLGVDIDATAGQIEKQLGDIGLGFIFAQKAHPAMKNVIDVRRSLGVPTIFNIIGPLANPVTLKGAYIGVYKENLVPIMAKSMVQLGIEYGAVVHGAGGLDEATLLGDNRVAIIKNRDIEHLKINASDYGLEPAPIEALKGGNAEENSQITLDILKGQIGPKRDVVLLNAGIALYAYGKVESIEAGIAKARLSIDSGDALEKLKQLKKASHY